MKITTDAKDFCIYCMRNCSQLDQQNDFVLQLEPQLKKKRIRGQSPFGDDIEIIIEPSVNLCSNCLRVYQPEMDLLLKVLIDKMEFEEELEQDRINKEFEQYYQHRRQKERRQIDRELEIQQK